MTEKIQGDQQFVAKPAERIDPWPTLEQLRARTIEIGDPRESLRLIRNKVRYADGRTLQTYFGPRR